jgi:hypothetical protein
MAITHDVRPLPHLSQPSLGPPVIFAAALAVAAVAWIFASQTFSSDATLPLVATLLFVLAALATLMAWRHAALPPQRLTYWDVAGALTFIGIGAAALIDPEQMLRLVATAPTEIEAIGTRR